MVDNLEEMMQNLSFTYMDRHERTISFEILFDYFESASISYEKGGYPDCQTSFDDFSAARGVTVEQLADKYMAILLEQTIGAVNGKERTDELLDYLGVEIDEWSGWVAHNLYTRDDFIEFFKNCYYNF